MQSKRYVTYTYKTKGFFGIGSKKKTATIEVPGIAGLISQLEAQRTDLIRKGEEALAQIPGNVAAKKQEIEDATRDRLLELEQEKDKFYEDILRSEFEPVAADLYRRILGRDAGEPEILSLITRFKAGGAIDLALLRSELENSSERIQRQADKDSIISEVRSFLNQYAASDDAGKALMLSPLGLSPSDEVRSTPSEITSILEWLDSRSLHFGQSAFEALREMLLSRGVSLAMTEIAVKTILIDMLTGIINVHNTQPNSELLISMFALNKVSSLYGESFSGVKYTFDDLLADYTSRALGSDWKRIAHMGEDHFVVITEVTAETVTYLETSKGANGELVTVTRGQFEAMWLVATNQPGLAAPTHGYLIVPTEAIPEAKQSQVLSVKETKQIRGAFFPPLIVAILFWVSLALTAASIIVSQFSPTAGKILGWIALGTGILSMVANIGNVVVQGLKTAFTEITSKGILGAIAHGFQAAGDLLMKSVTFVGRFIEKGFTFLVDTFTKGFSTFGEGITKLGTFLFQPAIKATASSVAKFSFEQTAARTLIGAGLSFGTSNGLNALGLDPTLSNLAGAFVGMGVAGMGVKGMSFFQSGLKGLLLQGVSEMGLKLDLPPPMIQVLSLAHSTSLDAYFSGGNLAINESLRSITPQLVAVGAKGAFEFAARSAGLNPTFTKLINVGIGALTSGLVSGIQNAGQPNAVFNSIQNSIFSKDTLVGLAGVGLDIVNDEVAEALGINPVLTALGFKGITSAVAGFLTADSKSAILQSTIEGLLGGVLKASADVAQNIVRNPQSMSLLLAGENLWDLLDRTAAESINRSSIEDLLLSYATIREAYLAARASAREVTVNSEPVMEVKMAGATGKEVTLYVKEKEGRPVDVVRMHLGDRILEGTIIF
ncbi:MAG: hypothetical protein HY586_02470, partial [Candidatus Omnitrophica bacterium]|nr:hypothetical protein [Candidatus Omnitrophota bacterium]